MFNYEASDLVVMGLTILQSQGWLMDLVDEARIEWLTAQAMAFAHVYSNRGPNHDTVYRALQSFLDAGVIMGGK